MAVLPEMKHLVILREHWVTNDEFRDIYSLGQLVPGPNMLMVIPLGYHIAGFAGAGLAFAGFFGPSSLIAYAFGRGWRRIAGTSWHRAISLGFAPIVVGLMAAGAIAVARTAVEGPATLGLAVAAFVALRVREKLNPTWLILAGGIFGWVFLR